MAGMTESACLQPAARNDDWDMLLWDPPDAYDSCSQHTATKLFTLSAEARPSVLEDSLPLFVGSKRNAKLLPVPEAGEISEAGSDEKSDLDACGGACSLGSSLSWRYAATSITFSLSTTNLGAGADRVVSMPQVRHNSLPAFSKLKQESGCQAKQAISPASASTSQPQEVGAALRHQPGELASLYLLFWKPGILHA